MSKEPTFEVTVFGKDWTRSFNRITGVRVAEGILLLTSQLPSCPYFAYAYPLAKVESWEVSEELRLSS